MFEANALDWIVSGEGGNMYEGRRYSLYNIDQEGYLRYDDRTGVNLGWSRGTNNFMMVKRKNPSGEPLKYGEQFALFIEEEWVMYHEQDVGINLSTRTSVNDYFEWKLVGGAEGSAVQLEQPVSLVNIRGGTVVGGKRLWGVNLCWTGDVKRVDGKHYRTDDIETLVREGKALASILVAIA